SMRILIRQGKGKRDRFTLLSKTNLDILTKYWYVYKPKHPDNYLFLNRSKNKMTTRGAGDIFRKALRKSGVKKPASIHTLSYPNLNKIQTFCINAFFYLTWHKKGLDFIC
ncbi:MAG: hypothetical protein K0S01_1982, partial [Herbinix sp.]|nr:hypothetical protein [Herbinix sp.]